MRRILTALTDAFRARGDELAATFDVAAEMTSCRKGAGAPHRRHGADLVTDGRVEFKGARHPLLDPGNKELTEGAKPKRRAWWVGRRSRGTCRRPGALVISGPNAGGKTVALKAMGLLALMAQAGMLIPVEPGSRFTPFRSVFADIGDEQSISASLVPFSAHIANIVAMDRALELPALVLLDEVGGADPAEGGALARQSSSTLRE